MKRFVRSRAATRMGRSGLPTTAAAMAFSLSIPSASASAVVIALGIGVTLAAPGIASAATRSMAGAFGVSNPDVAPPGRFDAGPGAFGKKFGPHPPTAGIRTIMATGLGSTAPGRKLTLSANAMVFQGGHFRDFPAFPGIAQSTKTYQSLHPAATFMIGGGALGFCPGPGCTETGNGTAISFCPPLSPSPQAPAPGTAMAPVGNWNCTQFTAAGPGRRSIRLSIQKAPGAPRFGGTLRLLRNQRATIWRVIEPPATPMAFAVVERAWRTGMFQEPAGGGNFVLESLPEHNGPRILAQLNARGAVTATAGCANGIGTIGPGKTFMGLPGPRGPFVPITGPGNVCGTDPVPAPPLQVFGFRMTTGTLSGSDFFPFLDATTVLGTPFAPNTQPRTFAHGMFFTRMGNDTAAPFGHTRNLVLLGGGIAHDPKSANAFFRVSELHLRIMVPEPRAAIGLTAGTAFLALLLARSAARRRSAARSMPTFEP